MGLGQGNESLIIPPLKEPAAQGGSFARASRQRKTEKDCGSFQKVSEGAAFTMSGEARGVAWVPAVWLKLGVGPLGPGGLAVSAQNLELIHR